MIGLTINGQPRRFDRPLSMQELLVQLDLADKRVAVERNGAIVPRTQFGATELSDGDALEIVVAVGGG